MLISETFVRSILSQSPFFLLLLQDRLGNEDLSTVKERTENKFPQNVAKHNWAWLTKLLTLNDSICRPYFPHSWDQCSGKVIYSFSKIIQLKSYRNTSVSRLLMTISFHCSFSCLLQDIQQWHYWNEATTRIPQVNHWRKTLRVICQPPSS